MASERITTDGRKAFPMRLYINDTQVGSHSTFCEYGPDAVTVAADCAAFYRAEGFERVETEVAMLAQWDGMTPVETVVVRCWGTKKG